LVNRLQNLGGLNNPNTYVIALLFRSFPALRWQQAVHVEYFFCLK